MVATARTASFSARPRSTPTNCGAIWPWHKEQTVGSSSAESGPAGQQDGRSAPAGHRPAPDRGSPGDRLVLHRIPLRLPCSAIRKIRARGPWQIQSSCSTHTTVIRIRHAILSQSVRRSASQKRPPRRSNDGQTILNAIWLDSESALASSRGEFHPPALSEPCVNLSIYTAPIIRSSAVTVWRASSGRRGTGTAFRPCAAPPWPASTCPGTACTSARPTAPGSR